MSMKSIFVVSDDYDLGLETNGNYDYFFILNTGPLNITLGPGVSNRVYRFCRKNDNTEIVTVSPFGDELINGKSSVGININTINSFVFINGSWLAVSQDISLL